MTKKIYRVYIDIVTQSFGGRRKTAEGLEIIQPQSDQDEQARDGNEQQQAPAAFAWHEVWYTAQHVMWESQTPASTPNKFLLGKEKS